MMRIEEDVRTNQRTDTAHINEQPLFDQFCADFDFANVKVTFEDEAKFSTPAPPINFQDGVEAEARTNMLTRLEKTRGL